MIAVIGYGLCAASFLMVALFSGLSRTGAVPRARHLPMAASLATAAWAAAEAASPWAGLSGPSPGGLLEVARTAGWLVFLAWVLGDGGAHVLDRARRRLVGVASAMAVVVAAAGQVAARFIPLEAYPEVAVADAVMRMLLAIGGLLLLENLFRTSERDARWAVKFLCFGLGIVFGYDFYLNADTALVRRPDPDLMAARGYVDALAAPLIAVGLSRADRWPLGVRVSRSVAFHTAALVGSGVYLLTMAAAGLYIRQIGGEWGAVAQIFFLSAAAVMLMAIFSSGSARARLRLLIAKHFFRYKYDYREEWHRFIRAVATPDASTGLHARVVRAVADIVDSPAGALWVLRPEDRVYAATASWNVAPDLPPLGADAPLVRFMARTGWVVDLDGMPDVEIPDWLCALPRAWLVVPFRHDDEVRAFLVLAGSRVPHGLDWEDYDLLRTVGHQAAGYLAEEQAKAALTDARQLEDFNRRFAFVVHDIKNVVGQMSLMMENAERFGDNPDFRRDMLVTVAGAVTRLRGLLEQLASRRCDGVSSGPIPLRPLVARVAAAWQSNGADISAEPGPVEVQAVADEDRLVGVLDHLLQNAVEAGGRVVLRLKVKGAEAVIEVADDGPGMDPAFVRDQLFRPLRTTKAAGFGLGAYQTRQTVRDMGGRLDVASAPGQGTTMGVVLPLAAAATTVPEGLERGTVEP